jgi:hypothetical protein
LERVNERVGWQRAAAGAMIIAVSILLSWTALQEWRFPSCQQRQRDYYNLLAHGFSKGGLALDMEVPAALKKIENPWDAAQRPPGLAPADITYYGGKFYLYFGVVPVALLIWPFQLLMGLDLPLVYVVIVFCVGAYLWLARLWWAVLRDHFPRASGVTRVGGLAVLGIAGGLLSLARRGSIWEMPIAAGQFFMAATVYSAYRAIHSAHPGRWLMAAGALLGLAVGSRPTLVVAGGGMVVLVLVVAWAEAAGAGWGRWGRRIVARALTAGAPLALIVVGLFYYNYARFGNPLEFGLNYQLTAGYEAKAQHFSFGFIHYNWLMYFWNSPQWGRDFPFVHAVNVPFAAPTGYYGYEYVYGALKISPVLWFGLVLPVWLLARTGGGRRAAFIGFLAALLVALTGVLLCFNTAAARYTADFLPWWLLAGLLGWATLEAGLHRRAGLRRLATGVFAMSALFTSVVAFCAGVELHGVFRFLNPTGYVAVARLFNQPVAWIDDVIGRPAGPLAVDIVFAEHPAAAYEPIVTTGVSYEASRIFVQYRGPGRLQFGFTQSGKPNVMSDEFTYEPRRKYRLRIESGAFYPTREHPVFTGASDADVSALKDWVSLRMDEKLLVEARFVVTDASPGSLQVGTDKVMGIRFSGSISNPKQMGLPKLIRQKSSGGDVVVTTTFPKTFEGGPQPLLMAGRTGNADFISLRQVDAKNVVFGYESWGAGFWEGAPVSIGAARVGSLRLRLGSMLELDRRSQLGVLRDSVAVWLDGRPVWWRSTLVPVAQPVTIEVGENSIQSTAIARRYEGRITHWERLPAPPSWRRGPFEEVELILGGRGEGTEPLAATGAAGRADTLAIEWRAGQRARLIYDHWGHDLLMSAEIPWPSETAHLLKIELPAFAHLDGAVVGEAKTGKLKVWMDDRLVWETEARCFVARSEELVFAKNEAGSSVVGEKLRAVVLDIVQGAPLDPRRP